MRRQRILIVVQAVLAAAGLIALRVLYVSELKQVVVPAIDPIGAAIFALAYMLLGAFGVLLPRGDLTDMTGTIAFAGGLVLEPVSAAAAVLFSRLALVVLKRGRANGWRVADEVTRQVLALACAGLVFLGLMFLGMGGRIGGSAPVGYTYLSVAAAAVVFFSLDFVLSQLASALRFGAPLFGLITGNLLLQGWMVAAQASVATLAVVMFSPLPSGVELSQLMKPGPHGVAHWYPIFGVGDHWATGVFGLVVAVALLMVMRQSFALLVEVRAAYRSTVEVLARAMEAEDPQRRGHGERVAMLAREVGRALGIHGADLEDLNYAALFHDVGKMGQEPIIGLAEIGSSADVLASAGFLADAVPILRVLEVAPEEPHGSESESVLVAAYIVARMSELDDEETVVEALGPPLSVQIGARLYAETRRVVDQAIRRIEERLRSGKLSLEQTVEESA
jgi:hypothetical protein